MPTLLRIDASIRLDGSYSRRLGNRFQQLWLERNPGGTIVHRDLALQPPPHLEQETLSAFFQPDLPATPGSSLSQELIDELLAADHVLVCTPVYNMGIPSTLKAYLDHLVRAGHTFESGPDGFRGLVGGRSATILVAQGATNSVTSPDAHAASQLRSTFSFMGLSPIDIVGLTGTMAPQDDSASILARGEAAVDALFRPDAPQWIGPFASSDAAAIEALRAGQVEAILLGDPERYADLCTPEVRTILPGRPPASGLDAFRGMARGLLGGTRFHALRKWPQRIELQGDLAIETGIQEVRSSPVATSPGAESIARQNYLQAMRRTGDGWKFDLLMTNSDA